MPATVFLDVALTRAYVGDVAEAIIRALEKEGNLGERYLVGNEDLTFAELNRTIHEILGVPLPPIHMPDAVASLSATLLTGLADLIKKPPP
jgi:dihydroflavonol-4-reductase